MVPITRRPRKRSTGETQILLDIRAALGRMPDVLLWRNNVGVLEDKRGVPVRFGLCEGSADLIGSVGGRPLAIEVKKPGEKPRPEQKAWLQLVANHGWVAGVVHSVEEAAALVEEGRREAAVWLP